MLANLKNIAPTKLTNKTTSNHGQRMQELRHILQIMRECQEKEMIKQHVKQISRKYTAA